MTRKEFVRGFHAVSSVIATRPGLISQLWYSKTRSDSRLLKSVSLARKLGIRTRATTRRSLVQLSGPNHQGIVAKVRDIPASTWSLRDSQLVLALDGVTDTTNIGSCLRVAEAAGADAVVTGVLPGGQVGDIVSKVSSGASWTIPVVSPSNLSSTLRSLRKLGHTVVGSDPNVSRSFFETKLRLPLTIVVGSEGKGIIGAVRRECHVLLRVPMWGNLPSLNVAVASGVMLFEIRRRTLVGRWL